MASLTLPPFAIIIPARFGSSRFPGKPLAELRGSSGIAKPLIQRSWEAAVATSEQNSVWVATDDARIADVVQRFGGNVVMTSEDCRNGTERCAEAAKKIPNCPDIVINFQGDAPLTPPSLVCQLVAALEENPAAAMATPAIRCSPSMYDHLVTDNLEGRVGGTTVVFNRNLEALYFSKRLLPYISPELRSAAEHVHLHLGIYAYRRDGLARYAAVAPSDLELLEGLEQLRFMTESQIIKVVPLDPVGWDCIELNNPTDIDPIESVLLQRGME